MAFRLLHSVSGKPWESPGYLISVACSASFTVSVAQGRHWRHPLFIPVDAQPRNVGIFQAQGLVSIGTGIELSTLGPTFSWSTVATTSGKDHLGVVAGDNFPTFMEVVMASLTIFQLNDSHGYLEPHSELFWKGGSAVYRTCGGYARVATVLRRAKQRSSAQVLSFDCGDTIHGTFLPVLTKGQAMVPVLNALGFDAMTAHWEFAYGPARFQHVAGQLQYPVLAINCYDKQTGDLVFPPYKIMEAAGARIGVIGIASNIVDKVMPPAYAEGVRFSHGREELPKYIDMLRVQERCDLIVVVSHLGFPQEMRLAQEVEGIDVLLSGHTHNRLFRPARVGSSLVIQSGCHGSFLGRLDLEVEGGRIVEFRHELMVMDEKVEPDIDVQAMISEALNPHRAMLSEVVGHTTTGLNRNATLESTMDNLLLASLLDLTGAQIAFSNGWRYGAPVAPGPITMNDMWNIIPTDPPVLTVDLTGEEIRGMLEENLERTFSCDPFEQMGGYLKRCMGLTVYVKIENPKGHRIQEIFAGNERLEAERSYQSVFVTMQGVPPRYGRNRADSGKRAIETLRRYISKQKTVSPTLVGSVVAV